MNAKLRKTVKIAAAGLFLAALAINVKVTLDDPFNMVNKEALAQQTTGGAKGPKLVNDCVTSGGDPGYRYICDGHNSEDCRVTPCTKD